MGRFNLVGPSYRSQSVSADCQTCMNLYLENIESGQGKSAAVLYRTPGLNLVYNLGTAGVRGQITAQGRTFAVAGTHLWELLAPTANPNKIDRGNIVSDGQPVSMASGPTQVLIASAGNLYCFQLVAGKTTNATGVVLALNSLTLLPQYNNATGYGLLGNVSQVVYGDGFFLSLIANSNQIQASNPLDGSSWQGVSQTQVSVFSDNVLAIHIDHRLLAVAGPNAIQIYFNSGNFPFPYDVVQGGFIEQGIAAPFSIAKLDNSAFWLGSDSRGSGIVWRANGYQPVRVSTHAIEYALSTYPTIADAVCYAYQDQGHTFYVMNFPTAQKTWVYDAATQMWHERGFWSVIGGNAVFTQSRAGFHTFNFGIHLVGDPTTGAIYQQSINFYSDFGNPIRRVRRAPHISKEQTRIFFTKLQLDLETGLGPVPPLQGEAIPTSYVLQGPSVPVLSGGSPTGFSIANGGLGYNDGDIITVLQGTNGSCELSVQIGGGGAIIAAHTVGLSDGIGYVPANNLPTSGGSGAGCLINILSATPIVTTLTPTFWNFSIADGGIIQAPPVLAGDPTTLFLNDQANTTSWQITMAATGIIQPVPIAFNPGLPQALPFVSTLGDQRWNLTLQNLGAGIGVLQTNPLGIVGRGPLVMMRRSNDGGHTWSNESARDCGQAGEYSKRVIWNREGSARDRVYEISVTDPIAWAFIDAYLFTDPEDKQPVSRFASEMRKRA